MGGCNTELFVTKQLSTEELDLLQTIRSKWQELARSELFIEIEPLHPEYRGAGLFDKIQEIYDTKLEGELSIYSNVRDDWEVVRFCALDISRKLPVLFDGYDMISALYIPKEYWLKRVSWDAVREHFDNYLEGKIGRIETFVTYAEGDQEIDHVFDMEFYQDNLKRIYGTLEIEETLTFRIRKIAKLARDLMYKKITLKEFKAILPNHEENEIVIKLIDMLECHNHVDNIFDPKNKLALDRQTQIFSLINRLET